ncbi:hypothetical protein CCM_05942 [Cordyceps militaris CM01]|uniref:Uncharacterized protein n=1 Tax=Cordyceps militaris (strain CM01) TaxID=983644 RepID=G3JHY2_CORMM|nr:uncharacterized protein CCM_05942 [Cordyceps militaris CM01]EGX91785.1 hypothetical protein CCM_05942 [Cordyceps militaris CM01]
MGTEATYPTLSIERLLPDSRWDTNPTRLAFRQKLAALTYWALYPDKATVPTLVVRDEYLGWVVEEPLCRIDYYGVTFDYLVPTEDTDPEVLQINILETENDGGEYANHWLDFEVNAVAYKNLSVLAVPRCCQKRKGTQDRHKVNEGVLERESALQVSNSR